MKFIITLLSLIGTSRFDSGCLHGSDNYKADDSIALLEENGNFVSLNLIAHEMGHV